MSKEPRLNEPDPIHATVVAWAGKGAVLSGRPGTGKTRIALELMAYGALLVSDDRIHLTASKDQLLASCPTEISGLIEARGLGILRAATVDDVPIRLWVDLDRPATERLPEVVSFRARGIDVPLFCAAECPHPAPMILQYLKAGAALDR